MGYKGAFVTMGKHNTLRINMIFFFFFFRVRFEHAKKKENEDKKQHILSEEGSHYTTPLNIHKRQVTGAFGYWCRAAESAGKALLTQAVHAGIWKTFAEGGRDLINELAQHRRRGHGKKQIRNPGRRIQKQSKRHREGRRRRVRASPQRMHGLNWAPLDERALLTKCHTLHCITAKSEDEEVLMKKDDKAEEGWNACIDACMHACIQKKLKAWIPNMGDSFIVTCECQYCHYLIFKNDL